MRFLLPVLVSCCLPVATLGNLYQSKVFLCHQGTSQIRVDQFTALKSVLQQQGYTNLNMRPAIDVKCSTTDAATCTQGLATMNNTFDAIAASAAAQTILILKLDIKMLYSTSQDGYIDPGMSVTEYQLMRLMDLGMKVVLLETSTPNLETKGAFLAMPDYSMANYLMATRACEFMEFGDVAVVMTYPDSQNKSPHESWPREDGFRKGLKAMCKFVDDSLIKLELAHSNAVPDSMGVLLRANRNIRLVYGHHENYVNRAVEAAKEARPEGTEGILFVSGTGMLETGPAYSLWKEGVLFAYSLEQRYTTDAGLLPSVSNQLRSYLQPPEGVTVPQTLLSSTFLRTQSKDADLAAHLTKGGRVLEKAGSVMNVSASFNVHTLSVNTKDNDFHARVELTFRWSDPRITWDARWGLGTVALPFEKVWHPVVAPVRYSKFETLKKDVQANSDGSIEMHSLIDMTIGCKYDFKDFPADKQYCKLAMSFGRSTLSGVSPVHVQTDPVMGDLLVPGFDALHYTSTHGTEFGFEFGLRRNSTKYFMLLVLPCLVFGLLTTLLFFTQNIVPRLFCCVITLGTLEGVQNRISTLTPLDSEPQWCSTFFFCNLAYIVLLFTCFLTNWDAPITKFIVKTYIKHSRKVTVAEAKAKRQSRIEEEAAAAEAAAEKEKETTIVSTEEGEGKNGEGKNGAGKVGEVKIEVLTDAEEKAKLQAIYAQIVKENMPSDATLDLMTMCFFGAAYAIMITLVMVQLDW